MTENERQLLLRDLCARQFYGTKVLGPWEKDGPCELSAIDLTSSRQIRVFEDWFRVEEVKPYLRPMSSMTEEEREEFRTLILPEASCAYEDCLEWDAQIIGGGYLQISVEDFSNVVDWLNAHHFDYRGLIEKGLALEALKGMYNLE